MRECGNAGIPEQRTTYYVPRFLIRSLIQECGNAGISTTYYIKVSKTVSNSGMRECWNTGTSYHVLPTKVSNTVSNSGMQECENTGTTYHVLGTKVSNTVSNSGMQECGNTGLRNDIQ